ncbi:plastocyanin/azurin family copper-binding protein [Halalkalibaculum sp. DA3122]|uniref:plastocyanin/azurin family copper-binding protein n=1 Tax=Halalkalibaculum sp. DA3122 TaxID=3373607 RepID=UPI0037542128
MKLTHIFTFIAFIALVGACGGGESSDQQQATQEESTSDVRTIEIIGIDAMKFAVESDAEGISVVDDLGSSDELVRLETISAQPGEEIRIELTTRSQLPATAMAHNWVLLSLDSDTKAFINAAVQAKENDYIPQDMTDQIIAETELAGGGETVSVTFTVPETPGEYEYVCSFPGHYSAGMRGTLVVE